MPWSSTPAGQDTHLHRLDDAADLPALGDAEFGDTHFGIGITDQRETAVVWDRRTLHSPRPAIVWQDRRTTGVCDRLREDEAHELAKELAYTLAKKAYRL